MKKRRRTRRKTRRGRKKRRRRIRLIDGKKGNSFAAIQSPGKTLVSSFYDA